MEIKRDRGVIFKNNSYSHAYITGLDTKFIITLIVYVILRCRLYGLAFNSFSMLHKASKSFPKLFRLKISTSGEPSFFLLLKVRYFLNSF